MEHIISVTVENKFGVLSRIAGLFSGRGFNIESLSVAPTLDPSMSQMTIVTSGDERIIEQIVKQLNKLIDVIKVVDLNESDFVSRETALIKVHTRAGGSGGGACGSPIFSAPTSSIRRPATYTIEVTGDPQKDRSDHQSTAATRHQRTDAYRTRCGRPRAAAVHRRRNPRKIARE